MALFTIRTPAVTEDAGAEDALKHLGVDYSRDGKIFKLKNGNHLKLFKEKDGGFALEPRDADKLAE